MKIKEIILLPSIIDKLIWKHHISEQEVREALRNRPKFLKIEKGKFEDEDLYSALCRTNLGRNLIIFFIHKKTHDALIISDRDMNDHERKKYGKNNTNKKIDPIPEKFDSIEEASDFWDSHSLADYWDQTTEVHFDIEIDEEPRYFVLEKQIAKKVYELAKKQKVSPETLVNLLVAEQVATLAN